jgi:hypothetical protein
MRIFPIPTCLERTYKGAGYALVALTPDETALLAIRYLHDIDLGVATHDDAGNGLPPAEVAAAVAASPRYELAARGFNLHGPVSFGMVSSWEFTEL